MKRISLVLSLLFVMSSLAQADCIGEAQIIAKTGQVLKKDYFSCVVSIDPSSIIQYNMNMLCPLDIDEVMAQGIEVGIVDGHDCRLDAGSSLTGIIHKTASGQLVLE